MAKCNCIFCKFKCSKCGAEDIKITYSPVFTFRNITEDFIPVLRETDMLELDCTECGAWIEPGDELLKVLNERLGIPSSTIFKHKDNGKIETVQLRPASKKQNCWEHMKCGREPEGEKVAELGICRAAADELFNGMNDGKNGGRICFAVAGTFSNHVVQCSCMEKLASCKDCSFFKIL